MAGIFWMIGFALLAQEFLCVLGDINVGCKKWSQDKKTSGNLYCNECHPGNRLVKKSDPDPTKLCTPCENGTYTTESLATECLICTQCVGALVHLKDCTPKSDTQCGCKKGLVCGDEHCSFCVDECGIGYEPTEKRSCAPCPKGTFNNQTHQKCKPLSTSCPKPNQVIEFKGNASSDIICKYLPPILPVTKPEKPGETEQGWPIVTFVIIGAFTICLIIFIVLVSVLIHHKGKTKKTPKTPLKTPIIRPPTDDPRTLIAIECSFHEAEQEQGNSTESLISKDSLKQDTV